ncbi:MAG: deoxyribose-phosphate aldolase [Acidobacteria bacterium]|nr:deoxyribose-phosphate aldolase [Acidobacteriota bacterium]
MIDHSLLRPELTDVQVSAGVALAVDYDVASVCVRPSDVDLAVRLLGGSGVLASSVVGFPHGGSTTAVKLYEARDMLRRGVREIDMVINIGKLKSREFQYVEMELIQMAKTCHEEGARLKVIFENAYLTEEEKIIACKMCKRSEVDWSKTSTGFAPTGYTKEDLELMVRKCRPYVQVKAAHGVRTLDQALEVHAIGATRFGATATAQILEDWKKRLAEMKAAAQPTVSERSANGQLQT